MQKTKKLLTIGTTAIALVWTLAMMPAPSFAAITINGSGNYSTIQAAIDDAGLDDTVEVAAGTYNECITMAPGVTIQGSGADVTTIQGDGRCMDWFGNTYTVLGASDSTISGFTITGSDYGIYNLSSWPTITNNTITGNNYGIYNNSSSAFWISNNIIANNNYGIHCSELLSPIITYNDVWGNSSGNYYGDCSVGNGNISADPLFVDPGSWDATGNWVQGDYHLQYNPPEEVSPCIDAGTNTAPALPDTDFDGRPRIVDGDDVDGAVVDMGAYEFVDSDGDGVGDD